ncbi:4124_t:CDS:2 [Scutellospora calospora]|uniref:4124_t:CDS:1 n=1 Tax=Scutellospora calospora TaxID=85575 RepID=A0ACA9KQ22_9GLOM|nr:4124_t:CDS:2 [Scutellospora calospora]
MLSFIANEVAIDLIIGLNLSNSQEALQVTSNNNTKFTSANATSVFAVKRKSKRISVVRLYFIKKIDDDEIVICIIYKNLFSKKTTIETLYKHLDAQHPSWNLNKKYKII